MANTVLLFAVILVSGGVLAENVTEEDRIQMILNEGLYAEEYEINPYLDESLIVKRFAGLPPGYEDEPSEVLMVPFSGTVRASGEVVITEHYGVDNIFGLPQQPQQPLSTSNFDTAPPSYNHNINPTHGTICPNCGANYPTCGPLGTVCPNCGTNYPDCGTICTDSVVPSGPMVPFSGTVPVEGQVVITAEFNDDGLEQLFARQNNYFASPNLCSTQKHYGGSPAGGFGRAATTPSIYDNTGNIVEYSSKSSTQIPSYTTGIPTSGFFHRTDSPLQFNTATKSSDHSSQYQDYFVDSIPRKLPLWDTQVIPTSSEVVQASKTNVQNSHAWTPQSVKNVKDYQLWAPQSLKNLQDNQLGTPQPQKNVQINQVWMPQSQRNVQTPLVWTWNPYLTLFKSLPQVNLPKNLPAYPQKPLSLMQPINRAPLVPKTVKKNEYKGKCNQMPYSPVYNNDQLQNFLVQDAQVPKTQVTYPQVINYQVPDIQVRNTQVPNQAPYPQVINTQVSDPQVYAQISKPQVRNAQVPNAQAPCPQVHAQILNTEVSDPQVYAQVSQPQVRNAQVPNAQAPCPQVHAQILNTQVSDPQLYAQVSQPQVRNTQVPNQAPYPQVHAQELYTQVSDPQVYAQVSQPQVRNAQVPNAQVPCPQVHAQILNTQVSDPQVYPQVSQPQVRNAQVNNAQAPSPQVHAQILNTQVSDPQLYAQVSQPQVRNTQVPNQAPYPQVHAQELYPQVSEPQVYAQVSQPQVRNAQVPSAQLPNTQGHPQGFIPTILSGPVMQVIQSPETVQKVDLSPYDGDMIPVVLEIPPFSFPWGVFQITSLPQVF